MDVDYSFYVKTIETYARTFLALNISAIGRVSSISLLTQCLTNTNKIGISKYLYFNKVSILPETLLVEAGNRPVA